MKHFIKIMSATAAIMATTAAAQDAGTYYSGLEVLQFQWSDTDGDDSQDALSSGARLTFGYNTSDDSSVRLRLFAFAAEDEDGSEMETGHADIEYVSAFDLSDNISAEVSAGVRFFKLATPTDEWQGSTGPVIAAKLTNELGGGFALYGGARSALVFGEETTGQELHQIRTTELSTGVNWTKAVANGTLDVHFGAEAHQYDSVRDSEEDYGLIGFAIGANYRF